MKVRASIEIGGACPYCGYPWRIELRNLRVENFAERCLDCGELFVIETSVSVDATVHALAGVDRDAVLTRLVERALSAANDVAPPSQPTQPDEPPGDAGAVEPPPPHAQASAPAGGAAPEAVAEMPSRRPENGRDRKPSRDGARISCDDRTRVRTRYQAALEEAFVKGRSRVPKKVVRELAAEFNIPEDLVEDIGNNRDSF